MRVVTWLLSCAFLLVAYSSEASAQAPEKKAVTKKSAPAAEKGKRAPRPRDADRAVRPEDRRQPGGADQGPERVPGRAALLGAQGRRRAPG